MREFFNTLKSSKISFNWNKSPIKMKLFLSFLTVDTKRESKFIGCDNGWTQITGENGLILSGGIISGVEYLDSIQYGKNLDNPYNNYVNPFYLFEILTDEGKAFFFDYYRDEIRAILDKCKAEAERAAAKLERTEKFWQQIGF